MSDTGGSFDVDDPILTLDDADVPDVAVLDGFLAGIALCPEAIPPEKWMTAAWLGANAIDDEAIAPKSWLGKKLQGALDDTVARVRRGGYKFIEATPDSGEPQRSPWSAWAEGFAEAVALRPGAWAAYQVDPATEKAMLGLRILMGYDRIRAGLPEDEVAKFARHVPDNIRDWIGSLAAKRLGAPLASARSKVGGLKGPLIGRNAPCPCGSGKKYKHCCGRQ